MIALYYSRLGACMPTANHLEGDTPRDPTFVSLEQIKSILHSLCMIIRPRPWNNVALEIFKYSMNKQREVSSDIDNNDVLRLIHVGLRCFH